MAADLLRRIEERARLAAACAQHHGIGRSMMAICNTKYGLFYSCLLLLAALASGMGRGAPAAAFNITSDDHIITTTILEIKIYSIITNC